MIAGNALNAILYALVLLCCIIAFGGSANFWTVLALNIFVGTIASAIPVPGGDTAVRSVGMSGALTAVGVATHRRGGGSAREPAGEQLPPRTSWMVRDEGPPCPRLPLGPQCTIS